MGIKKETWAEEWLITWKGVELGEGLHLVSSTDIVDREISCQLLFCVWREGEGC